SQRRVAKSVQAVSTRSRVAWVLAFPPAPGAGEGAGSVAAAQPANIPRHTKSRVWRNTQRYTTMTGPAVSAAKYRRARVRAIAARAFATAPRPDPSHATLRTSLFELPAARRKTDALHRRRTRHAQEGLAVGRRARVSGVPRYLRHRHEPPGLPHVVQNLERPPAHLGRTRVHPVDRHAARADCARQVALVARERSSTVRLRRGRLFPAIRADLYQHFEDARALGHPAAQREPQ